MVPFTLLDTLQIPDSESQTAGQESNAIITRLKATVDERVTWELNEIIKEIEKTCALEPFLNGYAQYTEWFRHREKTFTHFKVGTYFNVEINHVGI